MTLQTQVHTLPFVQSPDQPFPANTTGSTQIPPEATSYPPPPLSQKAPWGFGAALLVWVSSIVLMFLVPLVFVLPYAVSVGFKNFDPIGQTPVLLQVISIFPTHLLTLAIVWAVVTRLGRVPFWQAISWGWEWGQAFRLVSCIGIGVLLFGVGAAIAKLLGTDQPTQLEQIIKSSLAARYAISFLAVFTAPLVEELIYRGVLYAPLERLIGVRGAVALVLVLFTLIHVPQYLPNVGVIMAVGMLSIALTLVRAGTGRLMPCVVIHLIFNGVQAILLVLEPHLHRFVPPVDPAVPPALFVVSAIQHLF